MAPYSHNSNGQVENENARGFRDISLCYAQMHTLASNIKIKSLLVAATLACTLTQ